MVPRPGPSSTTRSVDGEPIARADMRVRFGSKEYTLEQMETVTDDRWELKQVASVTCLKRGGMKNDEIVRLTLQGAP